MSPVGAHLWSVVQVLLLFAQAGASIGIYIGLVRLELALVTSPVGLGLAQIGRVKEGWESVCFRRQFLVFSPEFACGSLPGPLAGCAPVSSEFDSASLQRPLPVSCKLFWARGLPAACSRGCLYGIRFWSFGIRMLVLGSEFWFGIRILGSEFGILGSEFWFGIRIWSFGIRILVWDQNFGFSHSMICWDQNFGSSCARAAALRPSRRQHPYIYWFSAFGAGACN